MFLLLACNAPREVQRQPMTEIVCEASHTLNYPAPDVPEGVLLQVLLQDNVHDRTSGYRIYQDGRYESRPQGQDWAIGSPLTREQLATVEQAIQAANLATLAPLYQPQQPEDDGDQILWTQVIQAGKPHSVAIQGSCRVPAIDTLNTQLVEMFKATH